MGIIDTVKEAIGLIQKVDNIDLIRRMLDLQTQAHALVDENRALQERLTLRDQLTFKRNAYWRGDEGPFCSRCWDDESKLVRLHSEKGYVGRCPKCREVVTDDYSNRGTGRARTEYDPLA